jgi:hypothetical protein
MNGYHDAAAPAAVTGQVQLLKMGELNMISAERALKDTPAYLQALIPLEDRIPDEVPGSVYGHIATGAMSVAAANRLMDSRVVIHSEYAERWMRHAWYEERNFEPSLISFAEHFDMANIDLHTSTGAA